MTYAGILSIYILPPCLLMIALFVRESQQNTKYNPRAGILAVLLHMLLALIYTTPWDNYLVANRVWWYDPALVVGINLAWVPLEEYTFFLLQTALTGFWFLWVRQRVAQREFNPSPVLRRKLSLIGLTIWSISLVILLFGPPEFTYLVLISIWAIPPILIQFVFGADILAANLRAVVLGILPPTIYLWFVDFLAIQWGTWTISPTQTTGLNLASLPVEEMLFFLATNVMVVFGISLLLASQSRHRARQLLVRLGLRPIDTRETV